MRFLFALFLVSSSFVIDTSTIPCVNAADISIEDTTMLLNEEKIDSILHENENIVSGADINIGIGTSTSTKNGDTITDPGPNSNDEEVETVTVSTEYEKEDEYENSASPSSTHHHGHWGTPSTHLHHANVHLKIKNASNTSSEGNKAGGGGGDHVSFMPHNNNKGNDTTIQYHHHEHYYKPPDAFTFKATITSESEFLYDGAVKNNNINNDDDDDGEARRTIQANVPSIPFLECNNIGTTTPSILNQATFRHFPKSGAHPTTFTQSRGFIIVLSSQIEIKVKGSQNGKSTKTRSKGEEVRVFHSGDVIWNDGGEYMMTVPDGCNDDLSVLIIHVDKKNSMIVGNHDGLGTSRHSCFVGVNGSGSYVPRGDLKEGKGSNIMDEEEVGLGLALVNGIMRIPARRVLLGSLGFSLSTLLTYFLSKVAPLQLAVGIGGLGLLTGGTCAIVLGGEWACDEVEKAWVESRKRRSIISDVDDDDNDDDNDEIYMEQDEDDKTKNAATMNTETQND